MTKSEMGTDFTKMGPPALHAGLMWAHLVSAAGQSGSLYTPSFKTRSWLRNRTKKQNPMIDSGA